MVSGQLAGITNRPLQVKITIQNSAGGGAYTYDPTAGANPPSTGIYDFRLISGSWTPPSDGVAGKFDMVIYDPTFSAILPNIKQKGEVAVWVGKTAGTLAKVFLGSIEHIIIEEPNQSMYFIHLTGPDWGSDIIRNRIINYGWYQQKLVASNNPDSGDLGTRVGTLAKAVLQNAPVYPNQYNNATIEGMGVVVDDANIFAGTDGGVSLPYFEASFEYAGDKLDELAAYAGAYWYVDPDKNFVMKSVPIDQSTVPDSGILLTDDYTDPVAASWASGKIGLIAPNTSYDLTSENSRKVIYGLGGNQISSDQSLTDTSAGSDALDSQYLAVKFVPAKQQIEQITVYVAKVGNPQSDLYLDLVYDSSGAPNGDNVRSLYISKDGIGTSVAPCTVAVGDNLIVGSPYWIILRKQGTALNGYRWYKKGSGAATASSSDGTTWSAGTAGYAFETWTSSPLYVTFPNAVVTNQLPNDYHESVIRKPFVRDYQTMNWFMAVESNYLFRYKEMFKCTIFAPDTLIQNSQRVRIRKQKSKYKFDANYVVSGIEYTFQGGDREATGTFYISGNFTLFTKNTTGQTTGQS